MPNISEIITNREKKFKKRNYRSWDLTGSEIDVLLNKKNANFSKDLADNQAAQQTSENQEKTTLETGVKIESNQSQTEAKVESNWSQSRVKVENRLSKTRAKVEPQLEPEPESNWSQSRDKLESNWSQISINPPQKNEISFLQLSGLQKEVVLFIYNICKNNRTEITDPISIRNVANISKTTISSAKKAIQRLQEKNLLKRVQFKNGRGGWSTYTLTKSIYQEVLQLETQHKLFNNWSQTGAKLEPNWSQTGAKVGTQLESQLEPSFSSSSSLINRSTTTESIVNDLDLDIEPLENIGFKKEHLAQIIRQGLIEPESIQQSISHFAYDYQSGHVKINTSPLKFFMGILKKGNVYISEHYVDPQEEKRKFFLEKYRQEKEEKKEIEKAIMCKKCTEWLNSLTPDEKKDIAISETPNHLKNHWANHMYDTLENHFKEKIWPTKRQDAYEIAGVPFISLREISG